MKNTTLKNKIKLYFTKRRLKKCFSKKKQVIRPRYMEATIAAYTISCIIFLVYVVVARAFAFTIEDMCDLFVIIILPLFLAYVMLPNFLLFTTPGWKILKWYNKKIGGYNLPSFHYFSKQEKRMLKYDSKTNCYRYKNTF